MLNTDGHVACAAAANLFWFDGERLCTPALDCGVLAGVVRGRVLARAAALGMKTVECRVARDALDRAETLFLTNSLIGVRAVSSLDGRAMEADLALLAALAP
jgi:branched-subunit amino acid aminotransferase/4-amino-4-deoxychorismate lyase